jgi:hypothetical protein
VVYVGLGTGRLEIVGPVNRRHDCILPRSLCEQAADVGARLRDVQTGCLHVEPWQPAGSGLWVWSCPRALAGDMHLSDCVLSTMAHRGNVRQKETVSHLPEIYRLLLKLFSLPHFWR